MGYDVNLASCLDIRPMKNMSDYLYQKISALIINGDLPEGYVFMNEAQLCEQLNVGRSTLREAYKALELTGYVTRSKRGGTVVNGQKEILAATPLKKSLERADKNDFNEYRLVFETANARGAADRRTEEELAELKELSKQMRECSLSDEGGHLELQRLDKEFHFKIASMTHNDLFRQMMMVMSQMWDEGVRKNWFVAKNEARFEGIFQQHEAIIKTIENCDKEGAAEKMKAHIMYVIN